MARIYSSTSVDTTLTSTINAVATSAAVVDANALLSGLPIPSGDTFTIALDPDTQSEEICVVTAVAGSTLTITRALAGTSAQEHVSGTTVRHVLTSLELTDFETVKSDHITATSTNTLTNKTINAANNTLVGLITTSSTDTLTNKTISVSSNTLTGVATLTGTETLTNKTITTPIISIGLNAQTASYTLQASDRNKLVTITSATAANFTVPSGVFSAGDVVYIARLGAGTVAATASGTTVNGTPGLNLRAQFSTAAIICTASNTFLLVGDLAA